jgi:type I thyroxine 5'-deiodinase
VRKLDIKFTTLIDNMDNAVELDYAGFPDRLYVVGRDGRIAWKSRPGPRGFRPVELEAAIEKEVR